MKILIVGASLLFTTLSFSQKPESVYSIVKERHEFAWYETQAKLWKGEIDLSKENGNAWYNYYMANRAMANLSEENEDRQMYMDKQESISKEAYQIIPNSFEANFLMYKSRKLETEVTKFAYLEKAFELRPSDPRTYVDFIVHYTIMNDQEKLNKFAIKFFNANEIAGPVYNWAYNQLAEVEENAIIFTAGDNDTFSFLALQAAKNFRKDVTIINTSLFLLNDYRKELMNKLEIKTSDLNVEECQSVSGLDSMKNILFQEIFENKKHPAYVSSTAAFQFEEEFGEDLYLTGLAYKYSKEKIDNISLIRRNYEKRYLLNHLTMNFSFNMADKVADRVNATYLPAFVKLYKHYRDCEEIEKMKILESYLVDISKKADKYEDIKKLIEG
ncbi:MAG: hypothetical protein ACI857_002436 [Arenicella sp.]|jgi:hypothetical protein